MKIYILTYYNYDFYDGCSERVIGAFTKEALDREYDKIIDKEMQFMMEGYLEDYNNNMKVALAEKEKAKQEVKELCHQMQSMNEFIEAAKNENDEITYWALVRDRRKLGRKVNQIISHAKSKIDAIEDEYQRIRKNIRENYRINEMDLVE